jgi:cystathionine gamma-lyase
MARDAHPGLGDGTRAVHAGLPDPEPGRPFLPGPTFAAPYHLPGDPADSPHGYGRYTNPTWTNYERALGELERGEAVAFASGMAAVAAVLLPLLRPGGVLVAPSDGYYNVRQLVREQLEPRGVEVRLVSTAASAAIGEALADASLVWLETPSNPGLEVCDLTEICERAHSSGAAVAVDNTLATPLGQRPLELGADYSVTSGTKALSGHADLLIGHVAVRDGERVEALRAWRGWTGGIPGPFEAWLAHRSLATLEVRLERQCANAQALAELLATRADVQAVRYPGLSRDPSHERASRQMRRFGPVVSFVLESRARAESFLSACELVVEATSFGGVVSSAERRARWSGDDVPDGFVRLSAGCEDTPDLLADVARALDLSAQG